ncbi:anthranilate synthase component II [Nocardioides marmoraquaticus]
MRAQRASKGAARVVVVDHHDSYTWNLVHLLAGLTGVLPEVVEHDEPGALGRAAAASHVVLSPGPGYPGAAQDFALGRAVFDLDVPLLGVCLGMQALVTAYGGTVARVAPAHGEVALVDHDGTGLFARVEGPFEAVRYHSLAATTVPSELRVTATERLDGVVMAVAHVSKPQVGVQFHPESVLSQAGEAIVEEFLSW